MEEAIVTHAVPTDIEWPPNVLQFDLLRFPLLFHWKDRSDVFVGGNMFVYFSLEQIKNQGFRGPEVFIVLGTTRRARKSWVVWQEGKGPDVVIELLSDSIAEKDKGEKKLIYQNQLRVPEYFGFHPISTELAGFALRDGIYEPIEPDAEGRLLNRQLGLMLTKWEGEYQGVQACWLRWATLEGTLLQTSEEAAEQERQKAEEARRKAEEAIQEAAELKALLARYRERFGELPE